MFFKILKHLLPKSEVWKIVIEKILKKFFQGITVFPKDIKDFVDNVYGDIFPQITRELQKWENQFNIILGKTEQERRDNITGRWRAQGGQGLDYLQDVLQSAGYNVFVHQWWYDTDPITVYYGNTGYTNAYTGNPNCDTGHEIILDYSIRNPNEYLENENLPIYQAYTGGPTDTGSPDGETGVLLSGTGKLLVNKGASFVDIRYQSYTGNPDDDTGNPDSETGVIYEIVFSEITYDVPTNVDDFSYILYIGAETFPEFAQIDADQQDEFERVILTYFPAYEWVGLLIDYI